MHVQVATPIDEDPQEAAIMQCSLGHQQQLHSKPCGVNLGGIQMGSFVMAEHVVEG